MMFVPKWDHKPIEIALHMRLLLRRRDTWEDCKRLDRMEGRKHDPLLDRWIDELDAKIQDLCKRLTGGEG